MAQPINTLNVHIDITRTSGFRLAVHFEAKKGCVTVIYGPSGSGKSTLLRLIAGLETHLRGVCIKADHELWSADKHFMPAHQRGVGYVSQYPNLFPHLDVSGNLQYAIKRRQSSSITSDQVCNWLDIAPLLHRPIVGLSGGETQRVAIARVLLNNPRLIVMDEPLGALDQRAKQKILPYIDQVHRYLDIPMVYVSHGADEVTYLADTIIMINQGRITAQGSALTVGSSIAFNHAQEDQAGAILGCTFDRYDKQYQLSALKVNRQTIFVSGHRHWTSKIIKLRIAAKDVSLSLHPPAYSSILNLLNAEVAEISSSTDTPAALVRLRIGEQYLLSKITRKSLDKLALKPGLRVYAQIKNVSFLSESI